VPNRQVVNAPSPQAIEIIEMVGVGREAIGGLIISDLKHLSNFMG
jgi:hypothetical protein